LCLEKVDKKKVPGPKQRERRKETGRTAAGFAREIEEKRLG
jgi:hypothetical protein